MSSSYVNSQLDIEDAEVVSEHPHSNDQLGFDPLSVASTGISVGKGAVDLVGSIFGGGGDNCNSQVREQENQIKQLLEEYTTYSERAQFIRSTGSRTSRISPTPSDMANFFIGEDDCKHKNVSSQHKVFLDKLQPWIEQKVTAKQQAQQQAQQQQQQQQQSSGQSPETAMTVANSGGGSSNMMWVAGGAGMILLVVGGAVIYTKNQ